MSAKVKVYTACPTCDSRYKVPAETVGHHARCAKCGTKFRVAKKSRHATEEDILRWLNDETEDHDRFGPPRQAPEPPRPDRLEASPLSPVFPESDRDPDHQPPAKPAASPSTDDEANNLIFRKTG